MRIGPFPSLRLSYYFGNTVGAAKDLVDGGVTRIRNEWSEFRSL